MRLEAAKHRSAVVLAFVDQAALHIRKKLQKVDGLAGESIKRVDGGCERGIQ